MTLTVIDRDLIEKKLMYRWCLKNGVPVEYKSLTDFQRRMVKQELNRMILLKDDQLEKEYKDAFSNS